MKTQARLLVAIAVAASSACTANPTLLPDQQSVPVLTAIQTLSIGAVEGDENYLFQHISDVTRLSSGNILAIDGGTELRTYSEDGRFLHRFGGKGQGPGEFQNATTIYQLQDDSIMVHDAWNTSLSIFHGHGIFAYQRPIADIAVDSLFPLSSWLYGRYMVEGPLDTGKRRSIETTLASYTPPSSGQGFRMVQTASDGRLWVREPGVSSSGGHVWIIIHPDGGPEAMVTFPTAFTPLEFGTAYVLGRWTDGMGIQTIRKYALEGSDLEADLPAWLRENALAESFPVDPNLDFLAEIKGALKHLASSQEIHYSEHYTYSQEIDSLKSFQAPEAIVVNIIEAGARGWVGAFTHPGLNSMCGLAYGFTVPAGWPNGGVICGDQAAPSTPLGSDLPQ